MIKIMTIILLLTFPMSAFSAIISIIPVSDISASDSDNDGIYETIDPEWLESVRISDMGYDPYPKRAAMEFALTSLPSNATINSAYFNFSASGWTSLSGNSAGLEVHGYQGDGVITGEDMVVNNFIGGPFRPSFDYQGSTDFTIDISTLLNGMNSNDYLGFRFGLFPDCSNCFINLITKEYAINLSQRPTVIIDYTVSPVPIPSAIWLFLSGSFILFGVIKRKSN